MIKQIEVYGKRVQLYSLDAGKTWSSNPQLIAAYGQRKKKFRFELQERFKRMDQISDPDPDPNSVAEFELPRSIVRR